MERANRQKQTDKLVFFSNLVLGSIAKKRMKRVGLVFHPPHLDEKLGIATWISEGEDSISDGK
jgi:hypothetical protein